MAETTAATGDDALVESTKLAGEIGGMSPFMSTVLAVDGCDSLDSWAYRVVGSSVPTKHLTTDMEIEKSCSRELWFYAAGRLCCAELLDHQPSGVKIKGIRLQSGEVFPEHKIAYRNDDVARAAATGTVEDWARSMG